MDRVQQELDGDAANLILAARKLQEGIDSLPIVAQAVLPTIELSLGKYVIVGRAPDYQN